MVWRLSILNLINGNATINEYVAVFYFLADRLGNIFLCTKSKAETLIELFYKKKNPDRILTRLLGVT